MTDFSLMTEELRSLSEGVNYPVSVLANASALIWQSMDNLNWAGFYIYHDGALRLGPFQGKVACTVIAEGKGVCGTAFSSDSTVVVPDVHAFPGHIACDSASNSEIVVPVHKNGSVYGVLDLDSPLFSRFGEEEKKGLETFVLELEKHI